MGLPLTTRVKRNHCSDKISERWGSEKCLFDIAQNMIGNKGETIFPSSSSDDTADADISSTSETVVMDAGVEFEG